MHRIDSNEFPDQPSFWADQQTASRIPIRDARQARFAYRARPERANRKARPKWSVPMRVGQMLSRNAACARAAFDGM